jgi:predicted nucleotidyltransferase component of viral defense system
LKPSTPRNLAASIRQKLLNIATRQREDFGMILTRYALERLLYRLGQSRHCDQFVLKGAMLFQVWSNTPHRPTRDLDLLGQGDPSPENSIVLFRELCGIAAPEDGLNFPIEAVAAEKIKGDEEYEGVRVRLQARLENARIPLQVDIGFGDALTTRPGVVDYPTLLPMPAPQIQAYPMEAVIAEKLEAMVHLGMLNSRMKDFFDVWFLARTFPFEAAALADSIQATFERPRYSGRPGSLRCPGWRISSGRLEAHSMASVPEQGQPDCDGELCRRSRRDWQVRVTAFARKFGRRSRNDSVAARRALARISSRCVALKAFVDSGTARKFR